MTELDVPPHPSFPILTAKRSFKRQFSARDWQREQCSTFGCHGVRAGTMGMVSDDKKLCLLCMEDEGAEIASKIAAIGETIDIRGCRVSRSWLEASRKGVRANHMVQLDLRWALIEDRANFGQLTFGNETSFEGASFGKWVSFRGAKFGNEAHFEDATFGRRADFWGATFGDEVHLEDATFGKRADFRGVKFGHGATFDDAKFEDDVSFYDAEFKDEATFFGTIFKDNADFRYSTFGKRALFGLAEFGRNANFGNGKFDDEANLGSKFGHRASFKDATFGNGAGFTPTLGAGADLSNASFRKPRVFRPKLTAPAKLLGIVVEGPASLRIKASDPEWTPYADEAKPGDLDLTLARFSDRVTIRGSGRLCLADVTFIEPSSVTSIEDQIAITSLSATNCELLTLQDCDLSICQLRGAIRLAGIGLDGDTKFNLTKGVRTRRKVIAEQSPAENSRDGETGENSAIAHAQLEGTYKSLRKALENSGDYPAASDFYYGQMLYRLKRAKGAERIIMEAYRTFGGFGVRAWRPFCWLVLLIIASAVMFTCWGLDQANFGTGLETSILAAISLTRPLRATGFEGIGFTVAVFLRILGPVLAGFGIFSLRSRVRR